MGAWQYTCRKKDEKVSKNTRKGKIRQKCERRVPLHNVACVSKNYLLSVLQVVDDVAIQEIRSLSACACEKMIQSV
jgi:hypothetical protein